MKIYEYYIDLRIAYQDRDDNQEIDITIEKLATVFRCTDRNVKFILKRLVNNDWISWNSGIGRGNYSKIIFKIALESILIDYFKVLVAEGKMNVAINLLHRINLAADLKDKMQVFLQEQFGFQVEHKSSDRFDILKIPVKRKFSTLDPSFVSVSTEAHLVKQIFDTLINYNPLTDEFEPNLAHFWEHSDDNKVWTFYLRKGITFHNGTNLTGKDVKYTFQRLADKQLNSPSNWQIESIEEIKVIDDLTISFYLKESNVFFLHFISSINTSIVPNGWVYTRNNLIGTGPFMLREYSEEKLILDRFPNFFKETALLDSIEFWYLLNTNIDLKYELPMIDYNITEKCSFTYYEEGSTYIAFNFNKSGIQHNINFRKAMHALLDRKAVIEDLKGNRFTPANSFLSSVSKIYDYTEKDLEYAKTMLEKSGYKGEALKLYHFEREKSTEDAIWLKKRAELIGLHLVLVPFPISDFYQKYIDEDADLLIMGEILEVDIELSLVKIYKHGSSFVRRFLNSEQILVIDKLITDFLNEINKDKRLDIILMIEEYLKEDLLLLFNYHIANQVNYHPALSGITLDSFGWADFRRLWNKSKKVKIDE